MDVLVTRLDANNIQRVNKNVILFLMEANHLNFTFATWQTPDRLL